MDEARADITITLLQLTIGAAITELDGTFRDARGVPEKDAREAILGIFRDAGCDILPDELDQLITEYREQGKVS